MNKTEWDIQAEEKTLAYSWYYLQYNDGLTVIGEYKQNTYGEDGFHDLAYPLEGLSVLGPVQMPGKDKPISKIDLLKAIIRFYQVNILDNGGELEVRKYKDTVRMYFYEQIYSTITEKTIDKITMIHNDLFLDLDYKMYEVKKSSSVYYKLYCACFAFKEDTNLNTVKGLAKIKGIL